MERSDTRPPWASLSSSAASSVLRSGALISERAWLRSRVRVSGLIVTSSDFGTTLRQTIVCSPRTLSTPVPPLATDRLDQLRQDLRDVVHDTIVGRLEDGGFRVRVDGDHRLGDRYVAAPRRRVPEHPHGRVILGQTDVDALDARLAPLIARGTGEDAGAN